MMMMIFPDGNDMLCMLLIVPKHQKKKKNKEVND